MIKSFKCKETEKIYNQQFSKKLPESIQATALKKLIMLNAASSLNDLLVPPGNRLEALSGQFQGYYSIRINDQFRLCFKSTENGFEEVEIIDYH